MINIKKYSLLLLGNLWCVLSLAQNADYSQGNSNPYVQYQYKSIAQGTSSSSLGYINNDKIYLPDVNLTSKYKNLLNNTSKIGSCWDSAAIAYKLDPWLLMAIAKVESSFQDDAINKNTNRSFDIGMMQINSIWFPTLKKFGIKPEHLLNACTSIYVGAWILAQNINSFGYNRDGIGAYNSPSNVVKRRIYAAKVYQSYNELIKDFRLTIAKN